MVLNYKLYLFPFLILGIITSSHFVFAEVLSTNDQTSSNITQPSQAQLEAQLNELNAQISNYEQQLGGITSQRKTLTNALTALKLQQQTISAQIQQSTLTLQSLSQQIDSTNQTISQNTEHAKTLQDEIGSLVVSIEEQDQQPLLFNLISANGFSNYADMLNNNQTITNELTAKLGELKTTNTALQNQTTELSSEQTDEQNVISIQSLQTTALQSKINDQATLVSETKGKESVYQTMINQTEEQADTIKNQIYQLFGISNNITFGDAAQIAEWVSGQTNVRAAFLLAILTQESSLGKNVGTCNRPGDPPSKSWKVIMKPSRDQQPFLAITQALQLDPNITPVSCPLHDAQGNQVGWGGAMGPAQFIPSTWVAYEGSVSAITGKPANPFDIRDAFIAAAIKLAANGATSQSGEWTAAMKYFSGSTNPKYSFYGDDVLALAAKYTTELQTIDQ